MYLNGHFCRVPIALHLTSASALASSFFSGCGPHGCINQDIASKMRAAGNEIRPCAGASNLHQLCEAIGEILRQSLTKLCR
jgi:hypothetical protein